MDSRAGVEQQAGFGRAVWGSLEALGAVMVESGESAVLAGADSWHLLLVQSITFLKGPGPPHHVQACGA